MYQFPPCLKPRLAPPWLVIPSILRNSASSLILFFFFLDYFFSFFFCIPFPHSLEQTLKRRAFSRFASILYLILHFFFLFLTHSFSISSSLAQVNTAGPSNLRGYDAVSKPRDIFY
ncbi:hypothetical protein V8C42DRAFT_150629 [Trichoderma barbatum]